MGSQSDTLATLVHVFVLESLFCGPTSVCLLNVLGCVTWYIFKVFSQCRVVVGYALQVSPAVTRLTVYRRLQVLRHGSGALPQNRFCNMMNFLRFGFKGRQRGQMDALEAQKSALTHTDARQ